MDTFWYEMVFYLTTFMLMLTLFSWPFSVLVSGRDASINLIGHILPEIRELCLRRLQTDKKAPLYPTV